MRRGIVLFCIAADIMLTATTTTRDRLLAASRSSMFQNSTAPAADQNNFRRTSAKCRGFGRKRSEAFPPGLPA